MGMIAFSIAVAGYAGIVIRFGFEITAVRDISRVLINKDEVDEQFNKTLFTSLFLTIGCLVFFIAIFNFGLFKYEGILFFSSFLYIAFQALLPVWFFQAIEKIKTVAILNGIFKLIYIFGVISFVKSPDDYLWVVILNALAMGGAFITSIFIIVNIYKVKIFMPSYRSIFICMKGSTDAFLSQLAPSLYNNSAVFILGLFSADKVVGVYSAVMGLLEAMISIGRVVFSAFISLLSKDIAYHRLYSQAMLAIGAFLSMFLMFFCDEIINIYFNQRNTLATELLFIGAVSVFGVFMFLSYNSGYLMIAGHEIIARNITIFCSVLSFIISLLLIYNFGAIGAVIAIVIARLLLGGVSWAFVLRVKKC